MVAIGHINEDIDAVQYLFANFIKFRFAILTRKIDVMLELYFTFLGKRI